MIATFEARPGQPPRILGERFSVADIMLGSSARFLRQFGMLPDSKILSAYAERCLDRPAYQKAIALEPQVG